MDPSSVDVTKFYISFALKFVWQFLWIFYQKMESQKNWAKNKKTEVNLIAIVLFAIAC